MSRQSKETIKTSILVLIITMALSFLVHPNKVDDKKVVAMTQVVHDKN